MSMFLAFPSGIGSRIRGKGCVPRPFTPWESRVAVCEHTGEKIGFLLVYLGSYLFPSYLFTNDCFAIVWNKAFITRLKSYFSIISSLTYFPKSIRQDFAIARPLG